MQIPILQINVNTGRREADPEAVQKLADSISRVGLLNPITVDQEYTLIAGLHRLEAAKRLGWLEIECTIKNLDGLLAQLAEIDENLIRREPDCIAQGELLNKRKEIYETLNPETKVGISQANGMNYTVGNNVSAPGALTSKSFVRDTAEKTGISKRTIEENLQLARDLTPKVKQVIHNASEKVKKKDMLKLSRLAPKQQEDAASQLAAGEIHSVDEYCPALVTAQDDVPPPAPQASEVCYPTIKASVEDLKNPDKDRRRTPDTFLMTFSFFLQRFCQGVTNYSTPEHEAIFPALTREQLRQIRAEIQSVHTALDGLFYKIERMARK